MRLFAFRGLHYDTDEGRAGEHTGELAAPPYDQIDDRLRDRLQAVSPYHFTHLTRPLPGEEGDPYRHAAHLHQQWLERGVVERDPRPAIYPYSIELPDGGRRLGICALIGLEPPDSAAIRPHEETLAKPLADRLALLEAMRVDLEPALLVADDAGALDALLSDDLAGRRPLVEHRDPGGCRHLLYRVDDGARIARYREALQQGPGAIADGHHRYKVAQRFAARSGASPGTAAATKLAVVTSLASPALAIDPIHRALAEAPDLARIEGLVASREPWEGRGGEELAAAVAAVPQPALGVRLADGTAELWRLDPRRAPEGIPAGARQLAVVLLHGVVFPSFGLSSESATDGTVLYRSDPRELWRMTSEGEAGAGFWLPPMAPEAFAAAIAEGDLLPPKSTRFLPKVVSGLVWADHSSELG